MTTGSAAVAVAPTRAALRCGLEVARRRGARRRRGGRRLLRSRRPAASPAPDWSDATITPLTTDPGYEGEPTFSPDGQTIAYVSDRDGNFEIYLQQISGGPALNLTNNPAADIQPAISPDGREIAFVSNRSGGSDIIHAAPSLPLVGGDIWVMPALGGPARRIVENAKFPVLDAGRLEPRLRSRHVPEHAHRDHSRDGRGEPRPADRRGLRSPVFLSEHLGGRTMAALPERPTRSRSAPAAGGKARVLARGESPAWGPGSTSVLYTNDTPGKERSLWRAPFSLARGEFSGRPAPLTFGRGADLGAKASRDGKTIAFSAVEESLNLEELPFDAEAGRATGPARELTAGSNRVGFFDVSPDGKAVVFAAERGARSHLWRIDPPAPPVELTRDPNHSDTFPEWSPDGTRDRVFSGRRGRRRGRPVALDHEGRRHQSAAASATFPGRLVWLPDRKAIVQRGQTMVRLDLASGVTSPDRGRAKVVTLLAVDRDGKWLAYQSSDGGLG